MEKERIIESEVIGRQRYFFLNRRYPLLKEIKKIYQSKFSLPLLLKQSLSRLVGLKEAYIFGSYAKNTLTPASDIDLLLVGSHDILKARAAVLSLQKRLGREINTIDFSEEEYQKRKADNDDFLSHVFTGRFIKII